MYTGCVPPNWIPCVESSPKQSPPVGGNQYQKSLIPKQAFSKERATGHPFARKFGCMALGHKALGFTNIYSWYKIYVLKYRWRARQLFTTIV